MLAMPIFNAGRTQALNSAAASADAALGRAQSLYDRGQIDLLPLLDAQRVRLAVRVEPTTPTRNCCSTACNCTRRSAVAGRRSRPSPVPLRRTTRIRLHHQTPLFDTRITSSPKVRDVQLDWNDPVRTLRVDLDQDKTRALGLAQADVAFVTQTVMNGATMLQLLEHEDLIDIVARTVPSERLDGMTKERSKNNLRKFIAGLEKRWDSIDQLWRIVFETFLRVRLLQEPPIRKAMTDSLPYRAHSGLHAGIARWALSIALQPQDHRFVQRERNSFPTRSTFVPSWRRMETDTRCSMGWSSGCIRSARVCPINDCH